MIRIHPPGRNQKRTRRSGPRSGRAFPPRLLLASYPTLTICLALSLCLTALGPTPVLSHDAIITPFRDTIRVARFSDPLSADSIPAGWLPISFGGDRGTTEYRETERDGRTCLLSQAQAAASGLVKPLVVDPGAFPRLRWRWWVPEPVPLAIMTDADDTGATASARYCDILLLGSHSSGSQGLPQS